MTSPTVHLVDDDASLLRGLSRMLSASGYPVRTFESAAGFLATHGGHRRGCVVADLEMPHMNGLELQAALAHSGNPLPVVFLTGHGQISSCVDAMKNGAQDFLTKPVCLEKLVAAVDRALAQDAAAFERISARENLELRFKRLTTRERQVLEHVVAGKLNKEIAADLGAAERTIKAHRASIMEKLQAHSPAELGSIAQEAGISGQVSASGFPPIPH
jgi:FixJ family two-component response regulator